MKYIIGIDEVGRGPLAGPVAVGVFVINSKDLVKIKKIFADATDSKQLTKIKRGEIYLRIKKLQKTDILRYIVRYQSNAYIDRHGITRAINSCIEKSIIKLKEELNLNCKNTEIFLDGGLKAPKEFTFQKTIIKGDQKNKIISLASIVAKVTRDNFMDRMNQKYPGYDFHVHKGYGTKKHKEAIKRYGVSPIHRKTWIY